MRYITDTLLTYLLTVVIAVIDFSEWLECILGIYTVGHKKRATFIFAITLANVDRFQ